MNDSPPQPRPQVNALWHRGQGLLVLVGALCVVSIIFLVFEIIRDLRYLNTAKSDNVHWVLSQTEVEFLEFRTAIEAAKATDGPDALSAVIVEFDVFYSRIDTLQSSRLYQPLRDLRGFGAPIAQVRSWLDAQIPLIDGPADVLRAGLADLGDGADTVRPLLRGAATTGLQFFVQNTEDSRKDFAATLLRLALMSSALIVALIVLLAFTRRIGRQTETRGKELSNAYARLNTILDTSLDGVIVSDLDGRILNFNPAAERIFHYKAQEVVGQSIADIIVPEHLRAAHSAGMQRWKHDGSRRVVGQGRVRLEALRRNGEVFPVELALEHARAQGNDMIVAFLRDISHQVAAETELVEARDKALAGEKAKAEFLAMMTHEIRTPLNGLLGNLALLEKTRLTAKQDRYVRNMDISGGLLMHHVDAVLDVARFESGAVPPREEVVHLGQLIQEIVDSQSSAVEAAGNHIQWGWTGAPATWVRLDASRLRQILLNLVGNAIKFTQDGRIVIEAEQTRSSDGPCLELRVIDTGIGISDEDQSRVFDDFQTLEKSNGSGASGTGLGLGIARRFVHAMQGEIGVESTPGEGSVFWLRLPLNAADGPEPPARNETPAPEVGSCDILLVEDNEINLELARETLLLMGHQVTEARNGREALDAAASRRFDLVLMDIRMPVMDGLVATRNLRSGDGPCRDAPIVAMSANVLPEARDAFIAAGMSGFLPKPLNEAELRRVIGQLVTTATETAEITKKAPDPMDPLERLRERYLQETRALFEWLANEPEEPAFIADEAHKVAGSAAAFGHPGLRDALVAVETAARAGDQAGLRAAVQTARKVWQDLPVPSL